jgi:hypothetical protein
MEPFDALLATDHRQTLEFFFIELEGDAAQHQGPRVRGVAPALCAAWTGPSRSGVHADQPVALSSGALRTRDGVRASAYLAAGR